MHAMKDFFTTDVGLASFGGTVFMIGMGMFFLRFFLRHMREDEARAQALRPRRAAAAGPQGLRATSPISAERPL